MTNTTITTGSRVTTNGGLIATVVSIKGRWVKIQFDHDQSEKNVGFKDVTPYVAPVEETDSGTKQSKNGVVDMAARRRYTINRIDGVTYVDNGDDVASALRGMELNDVYKAAADVLDVVPDTLRQQYAHLNPGMQRMNLGNRIRKAVKNDPALIVYVK